MNSTGIWRHLALCLSLLPSVSNAEKKLVEAVLKHPSGLEILTVQVWRANLHDPEDGSWTLDHAEAGFFVGRETEGYTQLLTKSPVLTRDPDTKKHRLYVEMLNPQQMNHLGTEALIIEVSKNGSGWDLADAKVTCPEISTCFTNSGVSRAKALSEQINQEKVELFPLPEARELYTILKAENANAYYVLDFNRRGDKFQTMEVLAVRDGIIEAVDIVKLEMQQALGFGFSHAVFRLSTGQRLQYDSLNRGGVLSSESGSTQLDELFPTPELLEQLGLSINRYQESAVVTPCRILKFGL